MTVSQDQVNDALLTQISLIIVRQTENDIDRKLSDKQWLYENSEETFFGYFRWNIKLDRPITKHQSQVVLRRYKNAGWKKVVPLFDRKMVIGFIFYQTEV